MEIKCKGKMPTILNGMNPCTLSYGPKQFTEQDYNHMETILRYNESAARAREANPNLGDKKQKGGKGGKKGGKAEKTPTESLFAMICRSKGTATED